MVVCAAHGTSLSSERSTEHLGKDVIGVRRESVGIPGAVSRPEPVKVLALLWVAQDLIGLLDLFKLLRVTCWLVGMKLKNEFAIGLLDVVRCGVPGQAEGLVGRLRIHSQTLILV